MSFEEALELLSRDERFKATVYAMYSLLIQRGICTRQEFERAFTEWAEKQRTAKGSSERLHLSAANV